MLGVRNLKSWTELGATGRMGEPERGLNSAVTLRPPGRKRFVRPAIGYLIGLACLIWLFHDVHPRAILSSAVGIQWGWAALAIVFDILSYVCQGWRWRLLLLPVGKVSTLKTTQAVYAGLFTNEVLPMRVGEVVRTYLVSRWLSTRITAVLPSLVVERFFDAMWLTICIGLTAILVPLPKNLLEAGDVLGGIVLGGTALFLYLVFSGRKTTLESPAGARGGWKTVRFVKKVFRHMEDGLQQIGLSAMFWGAFGLSLALLVGQILAFWLIMLACGLWLSFWVGAVVLLVVHLGTAIPNAPANVGTYQFFVVVGLSLFGVDKATATGFSFVVFFLLTIPLWLIGSLALTRSGLTLSSLRGKIRDLARESV